jgi:5'-phosphate synthase pdxT subunit
LVADRPSSPADSGGPSDPGPAIGVLALQGAFARHVAALRRCGAEAFEVRTADQLARCDALVLPGGESTTMLKLLRAFELVEPLEKLLADGVPTFGTCAGMILLARAVSDGRDDQTSFGAIDIDVRRNGYGRQIDSFEADLEVAALGHPPLRAVFIRAPVVERVGDGVEVLAVEERSGSGAVPVLCRQGPVLVSSFHPELTDDDRLHRYFLEQVAGR